MSGIKITINKSKVARINRKAQRAFELTARVLQDDIREEQVIPRDIGTLQGEAFFVDDSESSQGEIRLVHQTPYARRLYYHPEYNFSHRENANAQGMWFSPWLKGGKYQKRPAEIFSRLLKKEL